MVAHIFAYYTDACYGWRSHFIAGAKANSLGIIVGGALRHCLVFVVWKNAANQIMLYVSGETDCPSSIPNFDILAGHTLCHTTSQLSALYLILSLESTLS
jgi:hypothetical protein